MRFKNYIFLTIMLFVLSVSTFAQSEGVVPGVLRVKFKTTKAFSVDDLKIKETKAGTMQTGLKSVDVLNEQFQVHKFERVFPYNAKYDERHRKHGLHLWYQINYESKEEYKAIVNAYYSVTEIEISEPIYKKRAIPYEVKKFDDSQIKSGTTTFNDPYLPNQWHYNNTGQTGGTEGADANIYNAWEITTGSSNVIVSVHDEGVDVDHEDLAQNMWVNEAELNGVEGVDDDENGFVDDINGFNFISYKGDIDPMNHGTHVSGTVAAVNNNNIGVGGVAGGTGNGDGVKIMSCQILGDGSGNMAHSFIYAADNGAVISQNSWGYFYDGVYDQAVLDAIDYFIAEAGNYAGSPMKGGVVFFASGNNGIDGQHYPGYYSSTIAVNATNHTNLKAGYSNYGTWTDISAPGGDYSAGSESAVLSTLPNNTYGYMTGTSMACPHVSGIAALVVSEYGSSTFTNDDLKNRILTGYNNIDDLNPDYVGLIGVGAIDAEKTLAKDNGLAPANITDLAISSIAQDFINIDWNVPADDDDGAPLYFDIYYHTENITADNFIDATKVRIKNESGVAEAKTYRIDKLLPTTEYFMAIASIDRWGNKSDLSNVVSGTTNQGPDIDFNVTNISVSANEASNFIAEDTFKVYNKDEGLLIWGVEARHVKTTLTYGNVQYPTVVNSTVPYKANVGMEGVEKAQSPAIPYSTIWDYYEGYNFFIIGDEDTSITNSSALKFYVEQEEGFNLTNVEMLMRFTNINGPAILEVYYGEDINTAKLLLAQEVNSMSESSYTYNVYLTEQLYFEQGSTFWLVMHVPSGNLYPLGVGMEEVETYSDNAYMSFNYGRTWESLESVIGDPRWVWTTKARSNYDYLGEYITLTPTNGEILFEDSTDITLSIDGSQLINGTYKGNLIFDANDIDEPQSRIPVSFFVEGHKPEMIYDDIVELGSVLYGTSKTIEVTLQNAGLGKFKSALNQTISSPEFVSKLSNWTSINALSENIFTITFTPSAVGSFNALYTIVDKYGEEIKFSLHGVGAEPPVAEVTPDTTWFNNVTIGDTLTGSATVKNTGNYPLKYFLPAYADGSNMGEVAESIHKFGYTTEYTINDPDGLDPEFPYVWNDISSTGTSVEEHLKSMNVDYYPVEIGFEFPFYGEKYDTLYITDRGVLTFDDNSTFNTGGINYPSHPHGYISAYFSRLDMHIQGEVHYKRESGKLTVQYSNVGYLSGSTFYWVDIQMIIFDNGNIEYYIGDATMASYKIDGLNIRIENPEHDDAFEVNNSSYGALAVKIGLKKFSAIRIINSGYKLFNTVTNPFGTIQPGDSVNIDYTIETANLAEGLIYENVSVVSNDPFNNPILFTAVIDINAGGTADLFIDKDTIDLGQVFQNGSMSQTVVLSNIGTKGIEIDTVRMVNNYFVLTDTTEFFLKAKTSNYINLEFITANIGTYSDTLIIEDISGELFRVVLNGEVIDAPEVSVDITEVIDTLNIGETDLHSLVVSNTGGNNLEFTTNGNSWWYLHENTETGISNYENMTYTYTTSLSENGPAYNWGSIIETGTEWEDYDAVDPIKSWLEVVLPFTYNFYGIDYDTIYLGSNGVISFSPDQGSTFFTGTSKIPNPESVNNFIAPLHAFGTPTKYFNERGGVYYQEYTDKFVVEWVEFMDNYGMGNPMDVQLILFPDGSMKFQYSSLEYTRLDGNGIIGLENVDGTKGVQISAFQNFLQNHLAVSVTPAKQHIVAPGETKKFDIIMDATEAISGVYSDSLRIYSNAPINSETTIPIELTVNGFNQASAVGNNVLFSEIDLGTIMAYEKENELGNMEQVSYSKVFQIKNTGDTILNITDIDIAVANETVFEWGYVHPFWGLRWNPVSIWGSPALPEVYPNELSVFYFRVIVTPTGDTLADGSLVLPEIQDTLMFSLTTTVGEINIPVNAIITLPPTMESANDTLVILADSSSHVETKSFTITNNGLSPLDYSMDITFKREADYGFNDVTIASTSEMVVPTQSNYDFSKASQSVKVDGYDNTLEYDTLSTPSTSYGYGGDMGFASATEFTTPSAGFVLSHIMTWYIPGQVLNSTINYEVRIGEAITTSTVVESGSFTHDITTGDNVGSYLTTELQDSILFRPNEKFWIVYTYPIQATYPQGSATVSEDVSGRFHFGTGDGTWYDIIDGGGSGYGWMVKALEKTHYETAWASITNPAEGSVLAGETVTINVEFSAAYATETDSYAEIVISGNDPENSSDKVELYLRINSGPEFETITETYTVNENEVLDINIEATDLEGDNFTLSMAEAYDSVETTFNANILNFVYSPDYNSQGLQTFIVNGEDEYGNTSEFTINVEVVNVNRAPEAVAIDLIEIKEGGETYYISVTDLFTDPDGDNIEITSVVTSDGTIVQPYESGSDFVVISGVVGTATLTFDAKDIYEATVSNTVTFNVIGATGINELQLEGINIFPNPAVDYININFTKEISDDVSITLIDITGKELQNVNVGENSSSIQLDVKELPTGLYFLTIKGTDLDQAAKIIKK